MRFMPSYGGSLQVLGSPDRCHLVGEHICHPARSRGSCPPVGVLIISGPRLLHPRYITRKSGSSSSHWGTHLSSCSFQRFVPSCGGSCHVGTTFIASGTCLLHQEHICHLAHSGGSCPPVGVLIALGMCSSCHLSSCSFQRFVPSNGGSLQVLGGPSRHRIVHHPTCSIGFFPPVGVLFEFQEVQVIIVLSGMHSSCCSSSHLFRFIIWPSLSVSNA